MEEFLEIIIITLVSIPLGIVLGMGAVYVFNRMPAKWLCDYGEEPAPGLTDKNVKRLKDYPWKFIFTAGFIILGIYFGTRDYVFAGVALMQLWLLLMISISDMKYGIIPDQFVIFIALFAFPMSVYRAGIRDMIAGAVMGLVVMLIVAIIGKLISGKDSLGFGDVKLMAALGLSFGFTGICFVMVLTSVMTFISFSWGIIRRKIRKNEQKPLVPYIASSSLVYLFLAALTV